jgi:hypothetical protein
MTADAIGAAESRLDVARLVQAGVEGAVTETFDWPVMPMPKTEAPADRSPSA